MHCIYENAVTLTRRNHKPLQLYMYSYTVPAKWTVCVCKIVSKILYYNFPSITIIKFHHLVLKLYMASHHSPPTEPLPKIIPCVFSIEFISMLMKCLVQKIMDLGVITYTRFVTFTGNLTSTEFLVVYGSVKRNLFSQLSSSHLLTLCGKQKCMVSKYYFWITSPEFSLFS